MVRKVGPEGSELLSFEDLNAELATLSYKPGWKMTLWDDWQQGTMLYIVAQVTNSYSKDETTELRIISWVPPMETRRAFTEFIFWRLKMIEIHEVMEWFRRHDRPIYDPHLDADPPMKEVLRVWRRQHPDDEEEFDYA